VPPAPPAPTVIVNTLPGVIDPTDPDSIPPAPPPPGKPLEVPPPPPPATTRYCMVNVADVTVKLTVLVVVATSLPASRTLNVTLAEE
jgi:hypothetical protein